MNFYNIKILILLLVLCSGCISNKKLRSEPSFEQAKSFSKGYFKNTSMFNQSYEYSLLIQLVRNPFSRDTIPNWDKLTIELIRGDKIILVKGKYNEKG